MYASAWVYSTKLFKNHVARFKFIKNLMHSTENNNKINKKIKIFFASLFTVFVMITLALLTVGGTG